MGYFVDSVQITARERNHKYHQKTSPQRKEEKEDKAGFHGYFVNHLHFAVYIV